MKKLAAVVLISVSTVIFTSSALAIGSIQQSTTSVGLQQTKVVTHAREKMIIPKQPKPLIRK